MEFKSLKDKCLYYRGLTDYRLMPNSRVICMVDGRSFSKLIKNKFEKPFDKDFMYMMNESAKYVCENVEGCKFAYVQSDEVSFYITDINDEAGKTSDAFFGFRLNKMQSIIASLMSSKFNQLLMIYNIHHNLFNYSDGHGVVNTAIDVMENTKLAQFDCKCWTVPNDNDVYAWFLYRQLECIRNAKQAVAQKVCSHKMLEKLNADEQIALAKENGLDYNDFNDCEKYGRIIYREASEQKKIINDEEVTYMRNPFTIHPAYQFSEANTDIFFRK